MDYVLKTTHLELDFHKVMDTTDRVCIATYLDMVEDTIDAIFGAGWEAELGETLDILHRLMTQGVYEFSSL